jgi:GTPase SAR1 family protein
VIKKKICLLGSFGVGKTSLIRKYVMNLYSEQYVCTVGVKVDKKRLVLGSGGR